PTHWPAAGPEPLCELAHRVGHLPRARSANRGTERRLDAVRRTDPIRKRDEARVICAGTVVGRREVSGNGFDRDGAVRPAGARTAQDPLEHEMRHVGGWDNVILLCTVRRALCAGKPVVEEL